MGKFLTEDQFLLITLLVKLAVVAALATFLVRSKRFKRILLREDRPLRTRLALALTIGVPIALGVGSRVLLNYDAADLSLEGSFVAGLIGGHLVGALVGLIGGAPAALHSEFLGLPFVVGCGLLGGALRRLCPTEQIWDFSPFVVLSLHRYFWTFIRRLQGDWRLLLLATPVALELTRIGLGARVGQELLFHLISGRRVVLATIVTSTVFCVGIPIKIWNSARIEQKLQEQEKLLMAAKVEALASQINPHFLFNTLNSIASLIRTDPDQARTMIAKLSSILRRLLRSHDHFVTLREELESIDQYLDIEVARFGADKLRIDKRIDPATLDVIVPSMILQPLVENSIKHGFSSRIGGGWIAITSTRRNGVAVIEVADNGLGMAPERLDSALGGGIGLSNVNERLKVIYGPAYQLQLWSRPGEGTSARIEIPELEEARA